MSSARRIDRRMFLVELGRGTIGVAIFGVGVACGDDATATPAPSPSTTTAAAAATTIVSTTTPPIEGTGTDPPPGTLVPAGAVTWHRLDLGIVSAYVLARGERAALVDTGNRGAGGLTVIEEGLAAAGVGWDAVDHLIVTHKHSDHAGNVEPVLERADTAMVYAGEGDIDRIPATRPVTAVGDGDEVFGLQIIDTPGHTPGHISVLDPLGGLLVAGDALNGGGLRGGAVGALPEGTAGDVAGPNPAFTVDLARANESVKKLAALQFDTVVFGHGEPVEGDAAAKVAALAAEL